MSLENVQAGNTLIYIDGHTQPRVIIVDRVTKTQIIVGQIRYRKSDGLLIGHGIWTRGHIRWPRDDNEIAEIKNKERHKMLARRVSGMCELHQLRNMSLESLEQLNKVIQELTTGDSNGS